MKKSSLLLFLGCLFLTINVAGQKKSKKPQPFDSYGWIGYEDLGARLDGFANELESNPHLDAYVICYGPEGEGSGTGNYMLLSTKNYLVNTRGIDAERIQTIYGGRYKTPLEVSSELWLVAKGAEPPETKHYKGRAADETGKFAEYKGWDAIGDAEGPSLGNVTLAAFADELRQHPDTLAYIAAYNMRGAAPGAWRRVATRQSSDVQAYGVEDSRIKIIYGGIVGNTAKEDLQQVLIQLWILPKSAPPPVKEAKSEATPKKAMQIGTYEDYILKDPKEERLIFNGFADVLRANDQLNIFVVTRPRIEKLQQDGTGDNVPDIDPVKLAETWKVELTGKLGIKENRIIVIHAAADEFKQGEIEVWVAPPGADLPDPYASDDEMMQNKDPRMW